MIILIGAVIIGLTVGLMGSGGSVLTVPLLVYVMRHDAKLAIAESMAIVGTIALVSAVPYARQRQVSWRQSLLLGLPGIVGAVIGSWISVHYLSAATKMVLLAVIMLITSFRMLRKPKLPKGIELADVKKRAASAPTKIKERRHHFGKLLLETGQGLSIGLIAGTVGVGGGFLIVPTLVLMGGLGIRKAIGTSLVVIMMQSCIGFIGYQWQLWHLGESVHWSTVAVFSGVGSLAGLYGQRLGQRIHHDSLRRGFAILLLLMGALIVGKELIKILS